jgi:hypothetical protein
MEVAAGHVAILSQPRAEEPEIVAGLWTFQSLGLKFRATASLGDSSKLGKATPALPASKFPVGSSWRIGWVQVCVQEWSWSLYQAARRDEATLLESVPYTALDTATTDGRDIFSGLDAPSYSKLVGTQAATVDYVDLPDCQFQTALGAGVDRQPLSAVGIRLSFACALAARAPDDALYVLQWVPWFVQWSYDFADGPTGQNATRRPLGTKAAAGPIQSGIPPLLVQTLPGASGPSANVLADRPKKSTVLKGPQLKSRLASLRARG